MVIAVPAPLVIQRDDEEVGAFEMLQRRLPARVGRETCVFAVHDRLTERATHAVEDRGPQQEGLDVLGLPFKHLLEQVIEHKAMAARERGDEAGPVAGRRAG